MSSTKTVISGRDVITDFLKGDPVANITYKKICNAFDLIDKWEQPAVVQFIEQFLELGDLLDHQCKAIVNKLTRLNWILVPKEQRTAYRNMICEIGVRHVSHLETIYEGAVRNLIPRMTRTENGLVLELSREDQDEVYLMAHSIIAQLLICIPMSAKKVSVMIAKYFPHSSSDKHQLVGYVRNLLNMNGYANDMRDAIWDTLIDNLLHLDGLASGSKSVEYNEIFQLDEEEHTTEECGSRGEVLDECITLTCEYMAVSHLLQEDTKGHWFEISNEKNDEMVTALLKAFEAHLLTCTNTRYVSMIYLYLGSIDQKYCSRLLSLCWMVILRPCPVHGDMKKAHGAANYLAAFLARAKYVEQSLARWWLARMASYLVSYTDRVGLSSSVVLPGLIHHGVFYALSNAFFLVFCYRYKEIVKADLVEDVRTWCMGRFIHSPLDPLRFAVPSVARCFSAISRSLQLVYCSPHVGYTNEGVRPFEASFPFQSPLPSSPLFFDPLLRKFSPLAEDRLMLKEELAGFTQEEQQNDDDLDFLDMEDEVLPKSRCGPMVYMYPSSPTLYASPMDTR